MTINELTINALDISGSTIVMDQVFPLLHVGQVRGYERFVQFSVFSQANYERNLPFIQSEDIFVVIITRVQNGKFGVHAIGFEFVDGSDQRRGVNHVAGTAPEIDRQACILLCHVDEPHLVMILAVVKGVPEIKNEFLMVRTPRHGYE